MFHQRSRWHPAQRHRVPRRCLRAKRLSAPIRLAPQPVAIHTTSCTNGATTLRKLLLRPSRERNVRPSSPVRRQMIVGACGPQVVGRPPERETRPASAAVSPATWAPIRHGILAHSRDIMEGSPTNQRLFLNLPVRKLGLEKRVRLIPLEKLLVPLLVPDDPGIKWMFSEPDLLQRV